MPTPPMVASDTATTSRSQAAAESVGSGTAEGGGFTSGKVRLLLNAAPNIAPPPRLEALGFQWAASQYIIIILSY
jgi:hypothetical protein